MSKHGKKLLWLQISVAFLWMLSSLDSCLDRCTEKETNDRFARLSAVVSKQTSVARKTHD